MEVLLLLHNRRSILKSVSRESVYCVVHRFALPYVLMIYIYILGVNSSLPYHYALLTALHINNHPHMLQILHSY